VHSFSFSAGRPFASDLNGDGYPDIAAVGPYGSDAYIGVSLNNGDGTFDAGSKYDVWQYPRWVTAADVDSDGDMDVIATSDYYAQVNRISVWENVGDGTFSSRTDYVIYGHPRSIVAVDLNGDEHVDIAMASPNLGAGWPFVDSVFVKLNNGDGTFGSTSKYEVGRTPRSLTAGDIDGDGDLDLLATCQYSSWVTGLINSGDGIFSERRTYNMSTWPWAECVADVDKDGDLDLAVAIYGSDELSVCMNLSCIPGDANGSGEVDVDDYVYIMDYVFGGGPPPVPQLCCGDANASQNVDIDDVVYLINYIFLGGPAPIPVCEQ
jgi:hypothetical protein